VPIAIDRAQRSADVARVAAQLIAQGGLEAVTFRNLAAALGCSTTAISHYFPTRNDVLVATYTYIADRAQARRAQVQADGKHGVAEVLQQILPIGEDQSDDWKVWLCFWTSALFDPALAQIQQARNEVTRGEIRQLLVASGWSAAASRDLSRQMMTTIYGIAIQAIFDPAQWTPAQQRKALQHVLALASIGDAGPRRAPLPAGKRLRAGRAGRPAPGSPGKPA
jgi:AcrR family transcriptional regulator